MSAYDILEKHSTDSPWCGNILNFMVSHPLEKFAKIRLLDVDDALRELKELAKELHRLLELHSDNDDHGDDKQFEEEKVLTVFMVHVACIFARTMVETLASLSLTVEPHIAFWEGQCRLNSQGRRLTLHQKLRRYSSLAIASARARTFGNLSTALHVQMGQIQSWFWSFAASKLDSDMSSVQQFMAEMNGLFKPSLSDEAEDVGHGEAVEERHALHSMMESMSFADAFVAKLSGEIAQWGKPSHWRHNYKVYSFYSVSLAATSLLSYYHRHALRRLSCSTWSIVRNFYVEHFLEPMGGILSEVFDVDAGANSKEQMQRSFEMERDTLSEMIHSFERKHLGGATHSSSDSAADSDSLAMRRIMGKYREDIESPIVSATKGSLLTNLFIQIQKMKVEMSKLAVDVDDILDANKLNLEVMATIPFVGLFAVLHRMWSNQSGTNKVKKEAKRRLRFIFRSVYSVLVKSDNEQYAGHEGCGLLLLLMYKLQLWAQNAVANHFVSRDEFQWMTFDIDHAISCKFSVKQHMALLQRMERYYLQ